MAFSKPLSLVLVTFLFTLSHAAILEVINQCPFTVWAAAVPGGGARLDHGQTWLIDCPTELRASAGCNDPCTVFNNDQFCSSGPTGYSRFFKNNCPYVYTYPQDDANATFSCPSGTNYTVMFCP
ncbi:hypothetical protein ACFE04_007591 [Oxalis oulophora]